LDRVAGCWCERPCHHPIFSTSPSRENGSRKKTESLRHFTEGFNLRVIRSLESAGCISNATSLSLVPAIGNLQHRHPLNPDDAKPRKFANYSRHFRRVVRGARRGASYSAASRDIRSVCAFRSGRTGGRKTTGFQGCGTRSQPERHAGSFQWGDLSAGECRSANESADAGRREYARHSAARQPRRRSQRSAQIGAVRTAGFCRRKPSCRR